MIVAESGSDIPKDLADQNHIRIVPMHVSFGNATKDDMSFPTEEVFEHYRKTGSIPKTSGCNPEDFATAFDDLHRKFPDKHILHLAYSAVTSVSYQSAVIASEGRDYVTSIDTKSVSAGQSSVVLAVARYLEEHTDCSLKDVKSHVSKLVSRIRMGFIPEDLNYLRVGGRVSNAAYLGAKLLSIKPMIEIKDGKLMASKKYRGNALSIVPKFIHEYTEKHRFEKKKIALIYSLGLDQKIRDSMLSVVKEIGFCEILWIKAGCVISTHSGPNGFGIAGFSEA
ncbi:MAG: DegV family protein [Clostridiales bacterium]|nr:DegV family protein [Clostridiales bacterium]MDR2750135.1 DegV family protein [Clostridiales bacterium]